MNAHFYDMKDYNEYRRKKFSSSTSCPVISIEHRRVEYGYKKTNPKGGMTLITYWIGKDSAITGIAFCCDKDTYNKRKGKSIALGRLMRTIKKMGVSETIFSKHLKYVGERVGKVNLEFMTKAFDGEEIQ